MAVPQFGDHVPFEVTVSVLPAWLEPEIDGARVLPGAPGVQYGCTLPGGRVEAADVEDAALPAPPTSRTVAPARGHAKSASKEAPNDRRQAFERYRTVSDLSLDDPVGTAALPDEHTEPISCHHEYLRSSPWRSG
ncbi:MAG TPA: hypothetical protein VFA05_09500 [Gaiellaceae bacterium]|nr:hypothetical protein [Gaiellaceae bacterium]